jgi:hypothetical protein
MLDVTGRNASQPARFGGSCAENNAGKPRWVQEQRGGWHGADHLYQVRWTSVIGCYAETLRAMDESVGSIRGTTGSCWPSTG